MFYFCGTRNLLRFSLRISIEPIYYSNGRRLPSVVRQCPSLARQWAVKFPSIKKKLKARQWPLPDPPNESATATHIMKINLESQGDKD
eukprot:749286-Amorphochlora_amoeboformis.AAC.1